VPDFDLLVLGSGSTAFAAALRAQELGFRTLLTERRTIGGTCVNRGCLPSKNLLEAARLVHEARHPQIPGIGGAELPVDFARLVAQKRELVGGYRQKKYDSLLGSSFQLEEGHARLAGPRTLEIEGRRYTGRAVLIATGSQAVVPDIEGLDRVPWMTSDLLGSDGDELTTLPGSLLVLGAGYVGIELGQLFQRLGVEVTLLERGAEILTSGYEPEVGPVLRKLLETDGLRVLRQARLHSVRPHRQGLLATVHIGDQTTELYADRLLVAAGRRPATEGLGLQALGVGLGPRGGVRVDEQLRTSVPGVFAAGDVVEGVPMATPVGSHDGGIAAHNALSEEAPRRVDHRVVPRAVFCDPPLAVVGLTESQAVAAGRRVWSGTVPLELVPRAGASRDGRGLVKMVADAETHEVLGVTMLGAGAVEVIHEAAMGLRFRARLEDYVDLLHVYPSMAEALKIAAISRFKDPSRLSCCAE
jgi:mercuric reductase